jgi:hypothetical protein
MVKHGIIRIRSRFSQAWFCKPRRFPGIYHPLFTINISIHVDPFFWRLPRSTDVTIQCISPDYFASRLKIEKYFPPFVGRRRDFFLVINIFLCSWNATQVTIHLFYLSQRPLLHVGIFKTAEEFHNLNSSERDLPAARFLKLVSCPQAFHHGCLEAFKIYVPYLGDPWVEYRLLCIELRSVLPS